MNDGGAELGFVLLSCCVDSVGHISACSCLDLILLPVAIKLKVGTFVRLLIILVHEGVLVLAQDLVLMGVRSSAACLARLSLSGVELLGLLLFELVHVLII